jgi:hypothetical protein
MEIQDLLLDKINNTLTWCYDDNIISVKENDVQNAMVYKKYRMVIVLVGQDKNPSKMKGFLSNGVLKFEHSPPEGFMFSFLTEHPDIGLAVVCGATNKVNGWYDWHFSINPKTGDMKRYCPAY